MARCAPGPSMNRGHTENPPMTTAVSHKPQEEDLKGIRTPLRRAHGVARPGKPATLPIGPTWFPLCPRLELPQMST